LQFNKRKIINILKDAAKNHSTSQSGESELSAVIISTNNFRYYITTKNPDDSFYVLENTDSTNWIEWYVKREPTFGNMLHPSGIYSWKSINYTEDGTVILYDKTRSYYSRISNEGWFLKSPGNLDFRVHYDLGLQKGYWSAERPIEIINATRTFEICQRGVNNCADGGDKPGCCGPYGDNRCCNFNTN